MVFICILCLSYFFTLVHRSFFQDDTYHNIIISDNSNRADILDSRGVVIATALPTFSLYANPKHIKDKDESSALLADIFPEKSQLYFKELLQKKSSFVWIKRHLTPSEQSEIYNAGLSGVYFLQENKRVYPHGPLFSHILGYVGQDGDGLTGFEKYHNNQLKSQDIPITLSIDLRVQSVLKTELVNSINQYKATGGLGLIFNVNTGKLLGMVSIPDFDSNTFNIASNEAKFNRATLGVYEWGSTMKIVTMAGALSEKIIDLETAYDISEPLKVDKFEITDFSQSNNKNSSVREIFTKSSNIGMSKIGLDLGSKKQQSYFSKLGITSPLNIEITEKSKSIIPKKWTSITTTTASYGYGIAITAVHMAQALSTVINGGYLCPISILLNTPSHCERVLSEEVSQDMRELLRLVVEKGTGRRANAKGYMVGGKTGTGKKLENGEYKNDANVVSFIGSFPINNPQYGIVLLIDEPNKEVTHGNTKLLTGGYITAPIARKVIDKIAPILNIKPSN